MGRYERDESSEETPNWGRLAEIALPRFPELQRGESITYQEISNRLRELKRAGYDVKTKGPKEELEGELDKARRYIRMRAMESAPATLRAIERENEQKKSSRSIR